MPPRNCNSPGGASSKGTRKKKEAILADADSSVITDAAVAAKKTRQKTKQPVDEDTSERRQHDTEDVE